MSLQKFIDQKRGGEPLGADIKSNKAILDAAKAGREALKQLQSPGNSEDQDGLRIQQASKRVQRTIYICTCGHATCGIGPFVTPMTIYEDQISDYSRQAHFTMSPTR